MSAVSEIFQIRAILQLQADFTELNRVLQKFQATAPEDKAFLGDMKRLAEAIASTIENMAAACHSAVKPQRTIKRVVRGPDGLVDYIIDEPAGG
ncbi:MAG: hypothetical protein ACREXX_13175 [Gammaproteobacteria bacterium]